MTPTALKKSRKLDLDKVFIRILGLMLKFRPEEITFALVARHTGIPRSTLYYYFGSSRTTMLNEAIRFGMARFVQLHNIGKYTRFRDWRSFELHRMNHSLRVMSKNPWAVELYFRFRNDPGKLGESIRHFEEKYFEDITRVWKYFHPGKQPAMAGVRFSSYLKLGLFFGFSNDRLFWKKNTSRGVRDSFLKEFYELGSRLINSTA